MRARTSRKKEVVADDDLANIPLPIVSDRPTPEPTLGFENVVTAASRLILDRREKDGDQQGKGKNKKGGDDEAGARASRSASSASGGAASPPCFAP